MLRRLARNTIAGLVGTIALKLSAFVTTLVLARGLGEQDFGIYAFVGVFTLFFGFFTDLGIERILTRELAHQPQRAAVLLGNAITLRVSLCVVVVPLAMVVAWWMGLSPDVRYCVFLALLTLPMSLDLLFRSYFQSQFKIAFVYLVTLPASLLFLLLAFVCVTLRLPIYAIFYAGLLNAAFTLGLFLVFTLPRLTPLLRPDWGVLKLMLRDSAEMGAFVFMFMLAMRIDQLMLFQMRGADEVGYYAVAVRVTEALSIIPDALMLTVFPILAASQYSAPERFRHTYRLSFKYLGATILPLALFLTVVREDLIQIVFGVRYLSSATSLAILAWGMFFAYTGAVYLSLFVVKALQRLMLVVSVVTVSVNVVLNLLLIPPYGASGAAVATVVSSIVGFLFWAIHPATKAYIADCSRETLRPVFSVAVAAGVAWALGPGWLSAALGCGVYCVVLAALRGVSRDDIELIRELFAPEEVSEPTTRRPPKG